MTLNELTRSAILQAAAEYDRLGRDAFLERYGFGPSRGYLLEIDGKEYDSKAIVGAVHGYLPGRDPLGRDEFSGGKDHAAKLLTDLGFEVVVRTAG
ncbi:hypothetical protein ACWGPD_08515 [Streptomyces hirsutus]|uniref:hypothetical protein n=1 Tax=Streptomyces hirsutus TaxID=35620 RepID=UPI00363A64AF